MFALSTDYCADDGFIVGAMRLIDNAAWSVVVVVVSGMQLWNQDPAMLRWCPLQNDSRRSVANDKYNSMLLTCRSVPLDSGM